MAPGLSMAPTSAKIVSVRSMGKAWLYLIAGSVLLGSQAIFDYIGTSWANSHGNTIAAISAVVGVITTIYLINAFSDIRLARQEEQRFTNIKRIAFRSLSQTVNDLGRRLMGPVTGIDLFDAGIPNVSPEEVLNQRKRLKRFGLSPLEVSSGFWGSISSETLNQRIRILLQDPTFAPEMFRATSKARRELQSSLAEWAPVMVRVPQAYEELSAGWPLADQIVRLAEEWRSVQIAQAKQLEFDISILLLTFEETISSYRSWLEELQSNAELPTRGKYVHEKDWKS
jgi:hypothetical protein